MGRMSEQAGNALLSSVGVMSQMGTNASGYPRSCTWSLNSSTCSFKKRRMASQFLTRSRGRHDWRPDAFRPTHQFCASRAVRRSSRRGNGGATPHARRSRDGCFDRAVVSCAGALRPSRRSWLACAVGRRVTFAAASSRSSSRGRGNSVPCVALVTRSRRPPAASTTAVYRTGMLEAARRQSVRTPGENQTARFEVDRQYPRSG
jgi:hypothetical protein